MNKIYTVIRSQLNVKKYRIYLIAVLCLGVIMILAGNRITKEKNNTKSEITVCENENSREILVENNLETDLEDILSDVAGAGKIKVLISYESTDEKLVLKDTDGRGGENTVIYGDSSEKMPYIYKTLSPQIKGVIVVADGGDSYEIKNTIADAVSTVLEIPLHKVKVLKMK